MKLIVGLGNFEEKFTSTRHNIGFMVVEKLTKELLPLSRSEKAWKQEIKFTSEICKIHSGLLLIKPHTYMNRSGIAVKGIMDYYKIVIGDVYVVHDDIDLPLGKIRIRKGGGSGGHNGVESIITSLGSPDFLRFRLGIGRGKLDMEHSADYNLHRQDIEKFVLAPFRDSEAGDVKKLIKNAVTAVITTLDKGIEATMNRFN
jgi:peptidyl-tRNA hydrolase, PTH1 family